MEYELTFIEQLYWDAAKDLIPDLQKQEVIEASRNYRVDFAVPSKRLIIELDGHEFHSSPEQRTNDSIRQRELTRLGFTVIRFTGREVVANVDRCVKETLEQLTVLPEYHGPERTIDKVRYCTRMKEVFTQLLQQYGIDVESRFYSLRLEMDMHDDLHIKREGPLVFVAHFYNPTPGKLMPDPLYIFRVVRSGPESYTNWCLVKVRQLMGNRDFARVKDDDKIVITDFEIQHELTTLAEISASLFRMQGWFTDATLSEKPAFS